MKVEIQNFPNEFRAGMLGYRDGLGFNDCPYGHDGKTKPDYEPGKRQSWLAGWLEAQYFEKYWRRKGGESV